MEEQRAETEKLLTEQFLEPLKTLFLEVFENWLRILFCDLARHTVVFGTILDHFSVKTLSKLGLRN